MASLMSANRRVVSGNAYIGRPGSAGPTTLGLDTTCLLIEVAEGAVVAQTDALAGAAAWPDRSNQRRPPDTPSDGRPLRIGPPGYRSPRAWAPDPDAPHPIVAYSSPGGHAQTRWRSPAAASTRPTAGQNLWTRVQGAG